MLHSRGRVACAGVAAALAAVPLLADADDGRGVGVAVLGGVIKPKDNDGKSEPVVGGRLSVELDSRLTLGVDVSYINPDTQRENIPVPVSGQVWVEASGHVWEATSFVQVAAASAWLPYIRVHAGFNRAHADVSYGLDNRVYKQESSTENQLLVGAGLGYRLRMGPFLESFAEWNAHFNEGVNYYSVRAGIGVRGAKKPK